MKTTTDLSADDWRFLSALSGREKAAVVSGAEAYIARRLCMLGGDYALRVGSRKP